MQKKKKDKKAKKEREKAEAKVLDQFNEFLKAELPMGTLQDFVTRATDELNNLQAAAVNISQGIGNAIGNSISRGLQGLIEGTKTAQQVFADFLKNVADILLQEGTRMIATYIAIGIAKAFAGLAQGASSAGTSYSGGEVSGALSPSLTGVEGLKGDYFPTSTFFKPYAKGGFVSSPTSALVGEAGNEYVIPASKMRTAMQRYSAGMRGPGVISGADDNGDSGMGAPFAAVGPIDVRYTVERINDVEYVTADQFRSGMQKAAEQGARRGEQRTLANLRQNTTTRRKLGL